MRRRLPAPEPCPGLLYPPPGEPPGPPQRGQPLPRSRKRRFPAAVAYYEIPYENHETVTTQDGTVEENTTEGSLYYAFTVRYTDGAWSIAGAV